MKSLMYVFRILAALLIIPVIGTVNAHADINLALNKPVTASSSESSVQAPHYAVDGNGDSRWASEHSDNQWIAVDLGQVYAISRIRLNWEYAHGREYRLQVSSDGAQWTTIHSEANSDGGIDDIHVTGQGRYVRMQGVKRATPWGYSLWELEVYGTQPAAAPPAPLPESAPPPESDLIPPGAVNLALSRPVAASSMESGTLDASRAVDGLANSRWSSAHANNQWLSVDLGSSFYLTAIRLQWETAYASEYHIQTSQNGSTWTNAVTQTNGQGGVEVIRLNTEARYVRVFASKRATEWGVSLWEFEVYGVAASVNVARGKPATASSIESNSRSAGMAVDGNNNTRWASRATDSQWLTIDLGSAHQINRVKITWDSVYARRYLLQTSSNGQQWTTIFTENAGNGAVDDVYVNGVGRYLRMQGVARSATRSGYSIRELEIYGYASIPGSSSSSSSSVSSSSSSSSSAWSSSSSSASVSSNSSVSSSSSSSISSSSSSSPGVDTSAPTVPGSVTASAFESRIEIAWSPSIDNVAVTGYQVYRNNTRIADVSAVVTRYIDTSAVAGVTYSYSVRARDAAGNWSALSAPVSGKLATPVSLHWSSPTERENGEYLELNDIGGYEIRFKRPTDASYTRVVINDNRINSYTPASTDASFQYEIATFDTTGLYSNFVSIQPR